ncbi:hypothetical protein I2486_13850 [Cellulophaga sp. E16_2]|nr:hypothetical protein [Cellulophaga sp. E16_2]
MLVIDSRKDARAASASPIVPTRLMVSGVTGLVTDGGFRDIAEIPALAMPSYHQKPSAPTNLTVHQAIAINNPIGCGDVAVFPGDVLLGEDGGVMVIPATIAASVAQEASEMTLYEICLRKVDADYPINDFYPLPMIKFVQHLKLRKKLKVLIRRLNLLHRQDLELCTL